MRKKIIKLLFYIFFVLYSNNTFAEVLKKLEINGNERISNETIKVYGEIELNKDYQNEDVNDIIKRLYNTNFFSNISTKFNNGVLIIDVKENPIIYSIIIKGEQTKKYKEQILKLISLKEKSSFI